MISIYVSYTFATPTPTAYLVWTIRKTAESVEIQLALKGGKLALIKKDRHDCRNERLGVEDLHKYGYEQDGIGKSESRGWTSSSQNETHNMM